jgi:hypothetical protein
MVFLETLLKKDLADLWLKYENSGYRSLLSICLLSICLLSIYHFYCNFVALFRFLL